MLQKIRILIHKFSSYHISVYAGNAAFFLLLSIFPAATLLLGIVQLLPIETETILQAVNSLLPQAAAPIVSYILTVQNPVAVVSVSAVTYVWSASRGTYGVMRGLNRAYRRKETRGYLRARLACVLDTLFLIAAILAVLLLHVFGHPIAVLLQNSALSFLIYPIFRFLVSVAILTLLFCLVYLTFPNHHITFWKALPGAFCASLGWVLYSALLSAYVTYFPGMGQLYGSLSAVAITMLWLYVCMEILFAGGVLNRWMFP